MPTTTDNSTPQNVLKLIAEVQEVAKRFGYQDHKNGLFRDCITTKNATSPVIRKLENNEANFWFGFIREDQPESGAYDGLSFVIFPEQESTRCLVGICIGSSSIGKDGELAANPGFRRSFMRLNKVDENVNAKFFYKLRFDDMETSTPGLQEELFSQDAKYDEVMIATTTKYNADDKREDTPGLLPAAFIVDYSTQQGWALIKAWLAQYAKWRNWDKHKKGTDKNKPVQDIQTAIQACKTDTKCPDANEVKEILDKHHFVILQGAPGCGKTWTANEVAEKYDNVIFTQFHAETTYADFVYGIRPTLNGTNVAYKGEKGILLQAIDLANNDPEKKVLLIIDEINRANLANVLGPVFYLFEPQAEREHKLHLGHIVEGDTEKSIELSEIPKNLYVLGTMNTADKSLAVVDFALRRRFTWVTLRPHKLGTENFDSDLFDKVDDLFSRYATDEELNLQPGQSYFMDQALRTENIKYGLMPLMKEYFAEGFLLPAKEEFAQLFASNTGEYMFE